MKPGYDPYPCERLALLITIAIAIAIAAYELIRTLLSTQGH